MYLLKFRVLNGYLSSDSPMLKTYQNRKELIYNIGLNNIIDITRFKLNIFRKLIIICPSVRLMELCDPVLINVTSN